MLPARSCPLTLPSPDLSAADRWLAAKTATERKAHGQWVTPWWVVATVCEALAPTLSHGARVLDPACGDARWLVALGTLRPDLVLIGIDSDEGAIDAARHTLERAGCRAKLQHRDALSATAPLPRVDLIVGNPPYIRAQKLPKAKREALWQRFQTATNKSDVYACFVEASLAASPRVHLLLPDTWLSMSSYAALRRLLHERVSGVVRLPEYAFPGARVRTVWLQAEASDAPLAGDLDDNGVLTTRPLYRTDDSWSLDGPLPELPGVPLGSVCDLHMGVLCGDYARYVHPAPARHPLDRPTCRGRDVRDGHIHDGGEVLRYDPADMLRRKPYVSPKHAGLFDVPEKLIISGSGAGTIHCAVDTEQRFPLDSCYVGLPTGPLDVWVLHALLCSEPVQAWYGARHPAPRVKAVELRRIPVPQQVSPALAAAIKRGDTQAVRTGIAEAYRLG